MKRIIEILAIVTGMLLFITGCQSTNDNTNNFDYNPDQQYEEYYNDKVEQQEPVYQEPIQQQELKAKVQVTYNPVYGSMGSIVNYEVFYSIWNQGNTPINSVTVRYKCIYNYAGGWEYRQFTIPGTIEVGGYRQNFRAAFVPNNLVRIEDVQIIDIQ